MKISEHSCKFFGSNASLQRFLSDVRKYEVPSDDENRELVRKYRDGDEKSKNELICRHLRFIYSLAKIYARDEEEVCDYVNEGVIGLEEAIKRYDVDSENRLMTYGVWYIRRAMNFYLNDTRNMINRSNSSKLGKKIDTIKQNFFNVNGREASVEEIKKLVKDIYGIDVKEDCDVYDVSITSINEEVDDDFTMEETSEYAQKTASMNEYENTAEEDYKKMLVSAVLSLVPEKQADIIKMLYGIEYERSYSPKEIGEKYGIRAIEVVALRDKIIKYLQQNRDSIKREAL